MLFPIFLLSCIIPQTVLSGQIPVIDGVIGGVRTAQKATDRTKPTFIQSLAVTPGKLRYKENSGVCGMQLTVFQVK